MLLCLHLDSAGAVSGDWKDFLWPHVAQFLRERDMREFFWWCPLLPRFVCGSEWEDNIGSLKRPLRPGLKVSFPGSMHWPWCLWAEHEAIRLPWLSLQLYLFWLTLSLLRKGGWRTEGLPLVAFLQQGSPWALLSEVVKEIPPEPEWRINGCGYFLLTGDEEALIVFPPCVLRPAPPILVPCRVSGCLMAFLRFTKF